MKKRGFGVGLLLGILGGILLSLLFVAIAFPSFTDVLKKGGISVKEADGIVQKFDKLTRKIDGTYIEFIDEAARADMLEDAYKAYVSALDDKYSGYFTKEEYEAFLEELGGDYCGIGVTVTLDDDGRAYVLKVNKNGPCAKTEMRKGDYFVAVNTMSTDGMTLNEISELIRGEEGTEVSLTLLHPGEEIPYEVTLVRQRIVTESVSYKLAADGIGMITVSEFGGYTLRDFNAALEALEGEGIKALIIDLRDNPGGQLTTVNAMADIFLPEGIITYLEDKNGNRENYYAKEGALDLPVAILINGNSASASELFTGALRDYGVAFTVGTTSFGKGIAQVTSSLHDGTAIKLTEAKYYLPKGECIHGKGITPDFVVELPEGVRYSEDLDYALDTQLQKAVEELKKQLK